jgi:hypothetical protein
MRGESAFGKNSTEIPKLFPKFSREIEKSLQNGKNFGTNFPFCALTSSMETSLDTPATTDGEQNAGAVPSATPQKWAKRNRKGGTKGARKPSNLLKAMRWVSENAVKEGEVLTPLRANCRKLQVEDLTEFMRQLAGLEKAQAARKAPAPTSGLSGTGVPANGSSGPTRGDKGEETIFELIDKLVGEFK